MSRIAAWYWALAGLAAGIALGYALARRIMPPVFRRYPVLFWPENWLTAWKLRRKRRKMSEPDDRMTP
jgi:membrane protein DedA with SNARE-associated domain